MKCNFGFQQLTAWQVRSASATARLLTLEYSRRKEIGLSYEELDEDDECKSADSHIEIVGLSLSCKRKSRQWEESEGLIEQIYSLKSTLLSILSRMGLDVIWLSLRDTLVELAGLGEIVDNPM